MADQRDDDGVNNRNRNHLANAELADSGILLCEVRDGKAAPGRFISPGAYLETMRYPARINL